jgi:hypothetical protein
LSRYGHQLAAHPWQITIFRSPWDNGISHLTTMPTATTGLMSWPWSMISVLLTAATWPITIAVVIYYNRRPERRRRKLKFPGETHFVVPASQYHECSYAPQNEHEHLLKTIVLPARTDVTIDFCIRPAIDLDISQVILGCEGAVSDKPYAFEVFNRFIKTGNKRTGKPGTSNCDDYVDKYHYYHLVERVQWSLGTVRALGFKFKTGRPGIYYLHLAFTGDTIEGLSDDLKICVEDSPHTKMYCVIDTHMSMNCAAGLSPPLNQYSS